MFSFKFFDLMFHSREQMILNKFACRLEFRHVGHNYKLRFQFYANWGDWLNKKKRFASTMICYLKLL